MNETEMVQLHLEASLATGPGGEDCAQMLLAPVTPWLDITSFAARFGRMAKVVLTGSHATICLYGEPRFSLRLTDEIAAAARTNRQVLMTLGLDAVPEYCTDAEMTEYRIRSVKACRFVTHMLPVE